MKYELSKIHICCIIVTYNPDISLLTLLSLIENQVDKIIIVDNFSEKENCIIKEISQFKQIEFINNSINNGIATALNQGVFLAKELGYKWVITFDQDTKPFENIVDILLDVYNNYPNKTNIGAIGTNAIDLNNNVYFKSKSKLEYSVRNYLITSGTMISLKAFIEINGFCEKLFIDNVDIDYSLRLKINGYISLISIKCGMLHKPGDCISKKFLGINIESSNHNEFRRYFMSKNNFILTKKYIFYFPFFIFKMNFFYVLSLLKMILVEKNRQGKVKSTLTGAYDGIFNKNFNEYEF